ncbi:YidB family protein [Thiomonas intermedia]|uniref:YidB family protein n=1 Tax=Thiomonas intermedia TaxID=926 RepID=UPI0009A4C091|nr:YidB family protein [Thiomonas intermedia]
MGLFDSVAGGLGQMLGGQQAQGGAGDNPMLQAVMGLMNDSGGLSGLLSKFQQGGLGDLVQSWVGTGANLPISAEQIQQVLGSGALGDMASKLGIQPEQVAGALSQSLPQAVDAMTPNGQVPAASDLAGEVQNLIGGLFR